MKFRIFNPYSEAFWSHGDEPHEFVTEAAAVRSRNAAIAASYKRGASPMRITREEAVVVGSSEFAAWKEFG